MQSRGGEPEKKKKERRKATVLTADAAFHAPGWSLGSLRPHSPPLLPHLRFPALTPFSSPICASMSCVETAAEPPVPPPPAHCRPLLPATYRPARPQAPAPGARFHCCLQAPHPGVSDWMAGGPGTASSSTGHAHGSRSSEVEPDMSFRVVRVSTARTQCPQIGKSEVV